MRLHRLRLKDFRGITEREIEFADEGITVVEGANEAGKSSMIDALDLLLKTPSSSKSTQVKGVKPSGRDVGSEVFAEISSGPWHFEYFKRFNKRAETTLKILAPKREELTGREAHERVEQILAESLDSALFEALRLLQSGAPELGDLGDSSSLARALDRVAGTAADSSADGSGADGSDAGGSDVYGSDVDEADPAGAALIAAAITEYTRYYTLKAGRPAGELAAATTAAKAARAVVEEKTAALRAAEEAAADLPVIEAQHADAVQAGTHAEVHAADLGRSLAEAEKVEAAVREATARLAECNAHLELAERAVTDRANQDDRLAKFTGQVTDAEERAEAWRAEADVAANQVQERTAAAAVVRAERDRLGEQVARAEAAEQARIDRERIAAIEEALAQLAEIDRVRAENTAVAQANPVSPDEVARARTLTVELATAQARIDAVAATVDVTPLGAGEVAVDGASIDHEQSFAAVGETVIETPDVRVVVRGAASAREYAAELARLSEQRDHLLAECGVDTLEAVPVRAEERAEALRTVRQAEEDRKRMLAGGTEESLRAEAGRLTGGLPTQTAADLPPLAELRAQLSALGEQLAAAERAEVDLRALAGERRARAEAQTEQAESLRKTLMSERAAAIARRARHSDEALAAAVALARDDQSAAAKALAARQEELGAADPAGLRVAAEDAEQAAQRCRARSDELAQQRTRLRTVLEMARTENRLDDLGAAQATARAAEAELARVTERAEGAQLLYTTLSRTRADSRARYIAPFTRRLEELAAPVFGDSVRFEVADDFRILRRTLDGVTVDVTALSGGAREQLGLIARLACAMIVDEADGVPVILDDALGYSDPERLAAMGEVLSGAAGDAQIIVLTCTPGRYAAVPEARVVAV